MSNTRTINGFYGGLTPFETEIIICDLNNGFSWYAVKDSCNVNLCATDDLHEGMNVDDSDDVTDIDTCTVSGGIADESDIFTTFENDYASCP